MARKEPGYASRTQSASALLNNDTWYHGGAFSLTLCHGRERTMPRCCWLLKLAAEGLKERCPEDKAELELVDGMDEDFT